MRRWGVAISLLYTLIVLGLLIPAAVNLVGGEAPFWRDYMGNFKTIYEVWQNWLPIGAVLIGQAALLFLSVDTSWKRLKPRTHLGVTCAVASALIGLLTGAAIMACSATANEGGFLRFADWGSVFGLWAVLWVLWGVVFYLYVKGSSEAVSRAVGWLLKGSVLELLIVVPCHVIVRRRDECCAPVVTSFGIVTGVAVMLLSFGPSVLLLYKKRLEGYRRPESSASQP
jgi:hypothetical protein